MSNQQRLHDDYEVRLKIYVRWYLGAHMVLVSACANAHTVGFTDILFIFHVFRSDNIILFSNHSVTVIYP